MADGSVRAVGVVDRPRPGGVLLALCVTEITSWGVLYYAFPVLAPTIAPWLGASLAGPLDGYPGTFAVLGVIASVAVALAAGTIPAPQRQPVDLNR